MKKPSRLEAVFTLPFVALLATLAGPAEAREWIDPDELQTSVTLYFWLPSMEGDLEFRGNGGNATLDAGEILDTLQMAFMGALEFRKDEWSLLVDVIYLDLADDNSSRVDLPDGGAIQSDVDLEISGWQLGFYGGYRLYRSDRVSLDLLAGTRYLNLDADAKLGISGSLPPSLPSAHLTRSTSIWDAIVGVKGRVELDSHWFIPYYADIGSGDSKLTWQAMIGVGYQTEWGDVTTAYRHLTWDEGGDGLMQGLTFSGPGISVRYRF